MTNLSNAIRPVEITDPLEQEEKRLRLSQLTERSQAQARQAELAERDLADERNLRSLIGRNPKATPEEIIATGGFKSGTTYLNNRSNQRAADNTNEKSTFDLLTNKAKRRANIYASVKDQASYENAIRLSLAEGLTTPEDAQKGLSKPLDEQILAALQQEAKAQLGYAGMLEAEYKQTAEARNAAEELRKAAEHAAKLPGVTAESQQKVVIGQQVADLGMTKKEKDDADARAARDAATEADRKEQRRLTANGQAIQVRGQNMTDDRARDLNAATRENKPPSAAESRALGFYVRAEGAAKDLDTMEEEMSKKGLSDQVGYKIAPNFLQSDFNQAYRQASTAFTEARLRKDSGAAIPPSEYANDEKTYFPQPGDSKATLAQKKRGRETILRSLKLEAGRAVKAIGQEPGDRQPDQQPPPADKVISLADVQETARKAGKSAEQVMKDARAKGYVIR